MLAAAPKRLAGLGSSEDSLVAFRIEGRYCRFGGEEAVSGEGMGAFWQELAGTSVVATGYGPGDEALATLGIVGPTRMDYPGSMAAVRAVARYVSRILDEG